MITRIMLKDPDGVYESLADAKRNDGLTDEQATAITDKFFEFGEYAYIDIDLSDMSARVVLVEEN